MEFIRQIFFPRAVYVDIPPNPNGSLEHRAMHFDLLTGNIKREFSLLAAEEDRRKQEKLCSNAPLLSVVQKSPQIEVSRSSKGVAVKRRSP